MMANMNLTTAETSYDEVVGYTFISILLLCYFGYGCYQSQYGRGRGTFPQRLHQHLFFCCSINPRDDVEMAADVNFADMDDKISSRSKSPES
jgi:hypothetical protein